MKTVELHKAFWFVCDECSEENFVKTIVFSQAKIDRIKKQILEKFPNSEDNIGTICGQPNQVQCEYCGTIFETINPDEDANTDDEDTKILA